MNYQPHLKRLLDLLLVVVSIPISLPLMLLIGLINTIAFGGKPFFSQKRLGFENKPFKLLKFRSLSESGKVSLWSKLLRSSGFDELPQLINVVQGKMSLVGPRPLLMEYKATLEKKYAFRLSMKPGLTGLAQIQGRNLLSWEEKFAFDAKYQQSISLFADLKILLLTIPSLLLNSSDPGNLNRVEKLESSDKEIL